MNIPLKYTLFAMLFLVLSASLKGQTPIGEACRSAELWPQWPGCDTGMSNCTKSKLTEFISSNLQIPTEAKAQGLGGVVMVEFVVEKNGTIGEVRTLHDPGSGLGSAAMNVVSLMKEKKIKWTPAEENGKRVAFRYMTPVSFNLSRPAEEMQKLVVEDIVTPEVYDAVDVMPMYAGCTRTETDTIDCTFIQMLRHFQTNLKYPDAALSLGTQGPVVIEFIIDEQGNIIKPLIKSGLGHGCDEEA